MTRLHVSWWRRAVNRERPVAIPELPDEADAAAPLPGAPVEERDEVWRLLATIGPRQRAVLVLRFYEGLDDAEIAEVLGCAVGTVRSQASRGLAHLRDRLAARPSASTTPGRPADRSLGGRTRDDRSRPAPRRHLRAARRRCADRPGAGLAEVVTRAGGARSADAASPAPVWRPPRSSSASA